MLSFLRHLPLTLVALILISTSWTLAQQQVAANSTSSSINATNAANATQSNTAANATQSNTAANATQSNTANATSISNTNITSTSTSTPLTFPTATYASTAAIAGTYQAPFPPGSGVSGGAALGPDDSYIAAAASLLVGSSNMAYLAATMVMLVIGGVALL